MQHKWKHILTNWINCYVNKSSKKEQCVDLESLLNIISLLRQNLNLDESKSKLEAHTVEEFILEKYPAFKFDNGTTEVTNDEEYCIAASLLLFFVCVNSKDMDIKSAMCSKLSLEDQETILKFSKCLMECSPVSCSDVQTSIAEACGQDIAAGENAGNYAKVAETPPALRSLHGEVRRLQAALDAERFDRTYLQEELARKNLRLDKLLKEKEQYKLDVVSLKAKISLCCGQQKEMQGEEVAEKSSAKLERQLQDMEERLVATQEQLDDMRYERDAYKAKVDELKKDRDKWMSVSQQEASRAEQLANELETCQLSVQSLRELVSELRQHNQKNCLDSSQVECDDPDSTIQSLHNVSVCSETCAHVIEVQLGEERAKIGLLKQQIQSLQEQLNELSQKATSEKQMLESVNSEKEAEVFYLRHRINEEIKEKNSLKSHFNDEVSKLNNEINELDQKLRETFDNSKLVIEQKMQEIQNIQLEKLTLLQTLSNETNKFDNIIKDLCTDIDTEKNLKLKMKEDYENHIMKLNEKILNRNNELVELQNNIFEKSEIIEKLHYDLRKEKELSHELEKKYRCDITQLTDEKITLESIIAQKCEEAEELQKRLLQNNAEKDELEKNKIEKIGIIETLQHQLQLEIEFKTGLQDELTRIHYGKATLIEEVSRLNSELSKAKIEMQDKDRTLHALDLYLKEEKDINKNLKLDCDIKSDELKKMGEEIITKDSKIKAIDAKLESNNDLFKESLRKSDEIIETTNSKLLGEIAEKNELHAKLTSCKEEKRNLDKDLNERHEEVLQLQVDNKKLSQEVENNIKIIENMEKQLKEESQKYAQLEQIFDTQTSNLMAKLNETDKAFKEIKSRSKNTIEEKNLHIKTLEMEVEKLHEILDNDRENQEIVKKEKQVLLEKINEEVTYKTKFEKEYQNQCTALKNVTTQLTEQITQSNEEISVLKKEVQTLLKAVEEKTEELKLKEMELLKKTEAACEITYQKNSEIKALKEQIDKLMTSNDELVLELKQETSVKLQAIDAMQKENEQLLFTIEEDNSNHEVLINEKDSFIESLEEKLKVTEIHLASIRKDYEDKTLMWEKFKMELLEALHAKDSQITELTEHINELKKTSEQNMITADKVREDLKTQVDDVIRESKESDMKRREKALQDVTQYEILLKNSERVNTSLKEQLENESAIRNNLESEYKKVLEENDSLMKELYREQSERIALGNENKKLLSDKTILSQELLEERTLRQINDKERHALLKENERIVQQLHDETMIKTTILSEKELLTQQLIEIKYMKEHLENEKEILCAEKQALEQKLIEEIQYRDNLDLVKTSLVQQKQDLTYEVNVLNQKLLEESSTRKLILDEKHNVCEINETLKCNLTDRCAIQDVLMQDMELLKTDKETLITTLNGEKAARDEIESEKNEVTLELNKLNEKYSCDLNEKQEQLETLTVELKDLKTDYKKHEDFKLKISSILNSGLEKLLQYIKKEAICNEVMQKLLSVDKDENMPVNDKCELLINIADALTSELYSRQNLEKTLQDVCTQKEMQMLELQTELKRLQQVEYENTIELSRQTETLNMSVQSKVSDIKKLQLENVSLKNQLNDVKVQLEVKVHSLKEKLLDNENLTEKLKETYECQINNLNVMVTKLTNYLKDKTHELESTRKDKEALQLLCKDNDELRKSLEEEIKTKRLNQDKLVSDFESERQVLKNMIAVTESVMEDQKACFNEVISERLKVIEALQEDINNLQEIVNTEKMNAEIKIQEKETAFESAFKELTTLRDKHEQMKSEVTVQIQHSEKEIAALREELNVKVLFIETLEAQNKEIANSLEKLKTDNALLVKTNNEYKIQMESQEKELVSEIDKLTKALKEETANNDKLSFTLQENLQKTTQIKDENKALTEEIESLLREKTECLSIVDELNNKLQSNEVNMNIEISKLNKDKDNMISVIEENKKVIVQLEQHIQEQLIKKNKLFEDMANNRLNLENKCSLLEEYQTKAEKQLAEKDRDIFSLKECIESLRSATNTAELEVGNLKLKLDILEKDLEEKNTVINSIKEELVVEKATKEKYERQLQLKTASVYELKQKLEEGRKTVEQLELLRRQSDEMKLAAQREEFAVISQEKTSSRKYPSQSERDLRDQHQVSSPTSDFAYSSTESVKTITDLEKIIHDKNRTITALQSDVTYLKSLMAESENKLLDVTKELEVSKENCDQLSSQLSKIVHQKNEEIADLKKQVTKMSFTENRATQIIKVSAKYQAIILKRIAEIKSNTVLKELTNFGNTANCDNELRRGLNSGTITMEDLENFLETTDRHLKRCSEKQVALQKERDRLSEVNRINESEIINLKKFLSELSVSFKTFSSVKDLYTQKLSRVVSVQRTVRREVLNLEGRVTDAMMCKLERGYAAVMQDLSECAMNLERWMERCIGRTISAEKIKQAFTVEDKRSSLSSTSFQNTSLEVQLEELDKSFQKLLEEVVRAQKGEGAKDPQAVTVMEVRAEYEDKLNRMKAKMKQLYQEQILVFKEKQKEEILMLERELQKAREKQVESSRAYEEHIRALTMELWSVGEKLLVKKDEAEWLRRQQRSGSLMSLQHVHSSGLASLREQPPRESDSHSLRSLPVITNNREKREGRGLHMSDEEGEVFDNRFLRDLATTPRRDSHAPSPAPAPGQRLSELRWRNSLCPPHLKSSYPAEMQFAFTSTLDEEDIKCPEAAPSGAKQQRKEVGITAYKKPGPPTPSKQAGRLSATDSELREYLRVDSEPQTSRKTNTPSRLRALFRSSKPDGEGTPRRRLSNIFRRK